MSKKPKYSFLIAAPRSNSGKTLVTLGLIKALSNKGHNVQPFKCGPDYIDPMHHKIVSGNASYNLDSWMDTIENVQDIFNKQMQNADVGIVEGVMGLFDGAVKDKGSSADMAKLLSLPVVLVVDASSVAYSIAPLLFGFKNFDTKINLAGVIFNKVGSESHARFLKEAADDVGVEMLGYIPRDNRLKVESRHLGLHLPGENENHKIVDIAADLVEKHIDLEKLLQVSKKKVQAEAINTNVVEKRFKSIAIACDDAFNFSYQANIDALNQLGDLRFFSPITDKHVPDADIIWLPGGYPELFARELTSNQSMLQSINDFIEAGKTVVAECGGMMYLGQSIIDKNSKAYPMAGIFNVSTSFTKMKLHLGYREIDLGDFRLKGHEFHYSELVDRQEESMISHAKTARGLAVDMPVFRYKNCWASYMHLYLGNYKLMSIFLNNVNNEK